jgi:hypothetical protein
MSREPHKHIDLQRPRVEDVSDAVADAERSALLSGPNSTPEASAGFSVMAPRKVAGFYSPRVARIGFASPCAGRVSRIALAVRTRRRPTAAA